MFAGAAWLTIPVLLGLISAFIGLVRFIYTTFFSKNARAEAILKWSQEKQIRLEAERDRLRAANERIDADPPPPPGELGETLTDAWSKKTGRRARRRR